MAIEKITKERVKAKDGEPNSFEVVSLKEYIENLADKVNELIDELAKKADK